MRYPLLGLEDALANETCDSVTFQSPKKNTSAVHFRLGEDAWALAGEESDPIHTQDLLASITQDFRDDGDRLECCLCGEKITYRLERGSLRIERGTRKASTSDPETEQAGLRMIVNALGIPHSKRKLKLQQAQQFAKIVEQALGGKEKTTVRVLDLACGRSYLGFVLVHQLTAHGWIVKLHGVDSDGPLVDRCREIAKTLRWTNCTFEVADLSSYKVAAEAYDIMVALHACDTLTDEAIRIAYEGRIPLLFVAPCCQHELRHQWDVHPLDWVSRYGLLEQRLADVLTDAFRCSVLEALGYGVKVLRFAAPEITPKNLLIQAGLSGKLNPSRAATVCSFLEQFGVRPRLISVLEAVGFEMDGDQARGASDK
jgi:hypothetical protein